MFILCVAELNSCWSVFVFRLCWPLFCVLHHRERIETHIRNKRGEAELHGDGPAFSTYIILWLIKKNIPSAVTLLNKRTRPPGILHVYQWQCTPPCQIQAGLSSNKKCRPPHLITYRAHPSSLSSGELLDI